MRVEIDLSSATRACGGRGGGSEDDNRRDLQRTVENTIQVVLMGMRPKVECARMPSGAVGGRWIMGA